MADEGKKYYWLKLKRDFFKRHDIMIIEAMPNGKDYVLFYLKLLCESVDHEGNLRFSDKIPYNEDMLATITNTNVDIVRSAIKMFSSLGMMEVMDDGTYYMSEVSRLIGSESAWAEKKRVQREGAKKKDRLGHTEDNVLSIEDKSWTMSGQCPTEIELDIELERESKKELEREKKNRKPAASNIDQILSEFVLSDSLKEAIKDFAEFRKSVKAPLTDKAVKILINRLREMANTDEERIRILENSTMNGYKGIFEPKKSEKKPATGAFGNYDQRDFDYSEIEKKMRGYNDA